MSKAHTNQSDSLLREYRLYKFDKLQYPRIIIVAVVLRAGNHNAIHIVQVWIFLLRDYVEVAGLEVFWLEGRNECPLTGCYCGLEERGPDTAETAVDFLGLRERSVALEDGDA